jgi:replicative DNA helicase
MDITEAKEGVSLLEYARANSGGRVEKVGPDTYRIEPCPVCGHKEHFTLYADTNSYSSFSGCCKGGSIIDYLQEVEGLAQGPAIEKVKQLAGEAPRLALAPGQPAAADQEALKKNILALTEQGLESKAYHYYKSRGLSERIIKAYRLGYLPGGYDRPGYGEAFKYLLPVSDTFCILRSEDDNDKYRNIGSPELFNKAYLEDPSLTGQQIFITEGIFDALSLEDMGRPAVALNSIANKTKLLKALEENRQQLKEKVLVIALDTDPEGIKTAEAIADRAQGLGLQAVIFNLEGYKDINEALKKDDQELARQLEEGLQQQLEANKLKGTVYEYLTEEYELDQKKRIEEADIKTGFESLDRALGGGLYPGLYILGAISSLGKTALALQLADTVAAAQQQAIFFSLEMGRYEMAARSLTREYFIGEIEGLDMEGAIKLARGDNAISTGYVIKPRAAADVYSRPGFQKALEAYKQGPAKHLSLVEGDFNLTIAKMEDIIEASITRTGSRPVVFIDYLQVIQPAADSRLSDKQHVDQLVVRLKQLSRRLDLPVIAISSFSRAKYEDGPSMAAFKESGAIEYGADVLLYMQLRRGSNDDINEVKNEQPRPINLVILKNRRGLAYEEVKLDYYTKQNYFTENIH